MSESDWHTSKQNVYNWPSNKSDLRPHHDRLTSSRRSHAIRKSIGINSPQNHNHGPTAVIHLRPTSDWPVMFCDRLATDLRPGPDRFELPVWLGKVYMRRKKFKSDLRPIYDRAEWHTRPSSESRPTCDRRRIQVRVGTLVNETDKFHDLADQLPINREFGHFLVVSQSQVRREFGVNLA